MPRISLTPRGAAVGVLALPVLVLLPTLTTLLVCLGAWLLVLVLDAARTPSPDRLRITREAPAQIRLGTTAPGRLLVANTERRPVRLLLRDVWNPSAGLDQPRHTLRLPASERRAASQIFTPYRRGEHASRTVALAVCSPWGLVRRGARREVPGAFLALHPFGARRHLPSRMRRLREIEGLAAVHQRGQGTEFDSLRDFVDGDDVRSIDWRATARRRSVVVRTWRPERDRQVLIMIDTSRAGAARLGSVPRLDAQIDAALLLTALASQAGDRVDVLGMDRIAHVSVTGESTTRVLSEVVRATSPVEPALVEIDWEAAAAQILRRIRKGGLIVLITPVEAATMQQDLAGVVGRLAADHPVIIASTSDPGLQALAGERGTAHAVYRAAAAERSLQERAGVVRALERAGAHVVDAPPEGIAQGLADEYLRMKAAGLL